MDQQKIGETGTEAQDLGVLPKGPKRGCPAQLDDEQQRNLYCVPCNVEMDTDRKFKAHCKGKRHKRRYEELEKTKEKVNCMASKKPRHPDQNLYAPHEESTGRRGEHGQTCGGGSIRPATTALAQIQRPRWQSLTGSHQNKQPKPRLYPSASSDAKEATVASGTMLEKMASCVKASQKVAARANEIADTMVLSLRQHYISELDLKVEEKLLANAELELGQFQTIMESLRFFDDKVELTAKSTDREQPFCAAHLKNSHLPPSNHVPEHSLHQAPQQLPNAEASKQTTTDARARQRINPAIRSSVNNDSLVAASNTSEKTGQVSDYKLSATSVSTHASNTHYRNFSDQIVSVSSGQYSATQFPLNGQSSLSTAGASINLVKPSLPPLNTTLIDGYPR